MTKAFCIRRAWMLATMALTASLLMTGCSKASPERITVVPVDGRITFNGQPLPGAMIVLHPKTGGTATRPRRGAGRERRLVPLYDLRCRRRRPSR